MADAYRGARYFANMTVIMEMPALLVPGAGARNRINAAQKRATRTALVRAALEHHQTRIPLHFNRAQQKKYRYAKRARRTIQLKRRRGIANWDLVNTSATKREVTRKRSDVARPVHTSTGATAVLKMRFPAGMVPNRRGSKGITMQVMADEITRTTPREETEISEDTARFYLEEIDKEFTRRKRRRIPVIGGPMFAPIR